MIPPTLQLPLDFSVTFAAVGLEILIRELRIADTLPRLATASRCAYLFSTIRLRFPHDLAALVRHSRKYLVGDASFLQ